MRPTSPIAACRQILQSSGSSFASAFRILPGDQRDALTAFYAFCRKVDDAVDEAADVETARAELDLWRERVDSIYDGDPTGPVCQALGWASRRFGIERDHLELILRGVEQDLDVSRFATFSELYEYCYCVASAVGFVCVKVVGGGTPEVELYAELCGIAVQLTNILRDVGEDARRGRIYLPLEDLELFGVDEADFALGRSTREMKRLLRFQAQRARQYYELARAALPPRLRNQLFFPEALRETYSRLLDRLVDEDLPVYGERVSVSKIDKIAIALKHRLLLAPLLEWRR
jgi:phytoene synthase